MVVDKQFVKDRNKYRRLTRLVVIQVLINLGLAIAVIFAVVYPPAAKYYVSTSNGTILPIHLLSQPIFSEKSVEDWAALRARSIYNLNFYSWQKQVNANKAYFSDEGFQALNASYKQSNLLHALINDKLIVSSVVTKTPVVIDSGVQNGRYYWVVSMPLLLTLTSANKMTKESFNVTMYIHRVPVMDQSAGIVINKLQVSSAKQQLV